MKPSTTPTALRLAKKLARWKAYPEAFVRECIGATPDDWQVEAMRALRSHKRVSIAACHGVGKDALASWMVLWVMFTHPHPKIPCTAPTSHQLYDLLWSEIAKWYAKIHPAFKVGFELKRDRFEYKKHKETWFAVARTARKENSEALQGFHADNILIVVDEASGVPDIIFEVLEGAMTGPNAMQLLIGNPTQTSGYFYDSHHADRGRWYTLRISGIEDPEAGPSTRVSKRPSPEYVEAMRRKYGEDSNVFRVRVQGLFPKSGDDQAIPLEWIDRSAMRDVRQPGPRDALTLGVDVARFGSDFSAVVVREGTTILAASQWNGNDLATTTGRIVRLADDLHRERQDAGCWREGERLFLFVDTTGLGAGVADYLRAHAREKKKPWVVLDVDAGASSNDDTCHRKRDELWWKTREWFRTAEPAISPGIDRETREQLIGELASPKYGFLPSGVIKIESKDEMKKRGVPSPNLADALIHTFASPAHRPPEPNPNPYAALDKRRKGGTSWMSA